MPATHCHVKYPQNFSQGNTNAEKRVNNDSRGTQASLKVSKGFLWREEVIVLVLEVIQLQIPCSIHPKQLVPCGQSEVVRKGGGVSEREQHKRANKRLNIKNK